MATSFLAPYPGLIARNFHGDEEREQEAIVWSEGVIGDVSYAKR
jgi:hypothetical protein